jgi:hypothetical protein
MVPNRRWSVAPSTAALAVLGLACTADSARADVLPPPTFVIDSLYLGWPVGPIVGVALGAAAVGAFLGLRRRGTRTWLAVLLCLGSYAAVNFGCYILFLNTAARDREQQRPDFNLKHRPQPPPAPAVPARPAEPQKPSSPPAGTKPTPARTG